MTRTDLRTRLDAAGIDPNAYRLDGERADEAVVMEPQALGWAVYYSERGLRTGERLFADESSACAYLLDLLLRGGGVRRRVLPEFALHYDPADEVARALERGGSDGEIGLRHQLGGRPRGLNVPPFPVCPSCQEEMTFYGQFDSMPYEGYDLADAGLLLAFVCFDCFEVAARLQAG